MLPSTMHNATLCAAVISPGTRVGQHLQNAFSHLRWHSDTVATARAGEHRFTSVS